MKPESIILPLFPLYFVSLWLLVCFLISRMGWHSYSKFHTATSEAEGRGFFCSSLYFRFFWASYNNAVRVFFSNEGLRLSLFFLFRPFHPPLLLPWPLMKSLKKKKCLWMTSYELRIESEAGPLHLQLPEKALPELYQYRPDLPII